MSSGETVLSNSFWPKKTARLFPSFMEYLFLWSAKGSFLTDVDEEFQNSCRGFVFLRRFYRAANPIKS